MTEIGLFPILVSCLQRTNTIAYACFSGGVNVRWSFVDKSSIAELGVLVQPPLWPLKSGHLCAEEAAEELHAQVVTSISPGEAADAWHCDHEGNSFDHVLVMGRSVRTACVDPPAFPLPLWIRHSCRPL